MFYIKFKNNNAMVVLSAILVCFSVVAMAEAITAIGTNMSTDGNLTVGGNATTTGTFGVSGVTTLATTTFSGNVNFGFKEATNILLEKLSTFPSSPVQGLMFYSIASSTPYTYDGIRWKGDVSGATFVVAAFDSKNKENADYICDGTSDEVEIQAAIDALPSGGGKVLLLEGTYNVSISFNESAAIYLVDNVIFEGQGSGTNIKVSANNSGGFAWVVEANGKNNITVRDLQVDGDWESGNNNQLEGIGFRGSSRAKVENIYLHDVDSHFVSINGSNNVVITKSYFWNTEGHPNPNHGIDFEYYNGTSTKDVIVSYNYISNPGANADATKVENSSRVSYIGNHFYGTVYVDNNDGVNAYEDEDVLYSNNTFHNKFSIIQRTGKISVIGNMFTDGGYLTAYGGGGMLSIKDNTFNDGYINTYTDIGPIIEIEGNSLTGIPGSTFINVNSNNQPIEALIKNNYIDGSENDVSGIIFSGDGTANSTVALIGNNVKGFSGSVSSTGISVYKSDYSLISNNTVSDFFRNMYLEEVDYSKIDNNILKNSRGDLFYIKSSLYNTVNNNILSNAYTGYKVIRETDSSDFNKYYDNSFFGTVDIVKVGVGSEFYTNRGYNTSTSSTATITAGNTYVTATHYLDITPATSTINVTPTNNMGSAIKFWISNITSSDFRINVDQDPTADANFAWSVRDN